jgi:hypothetical protein
VVGVGDDGSIAAVGVLTHGSISMVPLLPSGCSKVVTWLVSEPPATTKEVMPLGDLLY